MSMESTAKTPTKERLVKWIGIVVAFVLIVLLARSATGALIGPNETAEEAAVVDSTTTTANDDDTEVTTTTTEAGPDDTSGIAPSDEEADDDPDAQSSEETVERETRMLIGDPIVLPTPTVAFVSRISVEPGVVTNLMTYLAAKRSTGTLAGPNDGGGDQSGPLDAPQVVDPVLGPPQQPLNVGLWVEEETSHLAAITVGVNPGPEGLADLTIDLGDGGTLSLDDRELSSLGNGGVVELIHRYEPTLTPQRQRVTAVATDGIGETATDSFDFATRAEFLARFSPLTVTSLGDCDLFGKGDFVLRWNIDGRPMSSEFKLGDGDSYVEPGFSIGLSGLTYETGDDFSISVRESDSLGVEILKVLADPFEGFRGPPGAKFLDVIEFGTHIVPFTIVRDVANNDCKVQLDFTATIAVDERTDV